MSLGSQWPLTKTTDISALRVPREDGQAHREKENEKERNTKRAKKKKERRLKRRKGTWRNIN